MGKGQVSNCPNLQGLCKMTFPFKTLSTNDPTPSCTNAVRTIADGWFWGEAFSWRAAFFPPDPPRTSRLERASLWLTFHNPPAQHGQGNPTRLHFFFSPSPLSISNNERSSFQTKKRGLGQTKSTSRKQDGNFMMQCFHFHWTSDSQLFPLFKQKSQGRIIIKKGHGSFPWMLKKNSEITHCILNLYINTNPNTHIWQS